MTLPNTLRQVMPKQALARLAKKKEQNIAPNKSAEANNIENLLAKLNTIVRTLDVESKRSFSMLFDLCNDLVGNMVHRQNEVEYDEIHSYALEVLTHARESSHYQEIQNNIKLLMQNVRACVAQRAEYQIVNRNSKYAQGSEDFNIAEAMVKNVLLNVGNLDAPNKSQQGRTTVYNAHPTIPGTLYIELQNFQFKGPAEISAFVSNYGLVQANDYGIPNMLGTQDRARVYGFHPRLFYLILQNNRTIDDYVRPGNIVIAYSEASHKHCSVSMFLRHLKQVYCNPSFRDTTSNKRNANAMSRYYVGTRIVIEDHIRQMHADSEREARVLQNSKKPPSVYEAGLMREYNLNIEQVRNLIAQSPTEISSELVSEIQTRGQIKFEECQALKEEIADRVIRRLCQAFRSAYNTGNTNSNNNNGTAQASTKKPPEIHTDTIYQVVTDRGPIKRYVRTTKIYGDKGIANCDVVLSSNKKDTKQTTIDLSLLCEPDRYPKFMHSPDIWMSKVSQSASETRAEMARVVKAYLQSTHATANQEQEQATRTVNNIKALLKGYFGGFTLALFLNFAKNLINKSINVTETKQEDKSYKGKVSEMNRIWNKKNLEGLLFSRTGKLTNKPTTQA